MKNRVKSKPLETVLKGIAAAVFLAGILLAGYGITRVIFNYTGSPGVPFDYVISGLVGIFACWLVVFFVGIIMRKKGHWTHFQSTDNFIDAINAVSQGNFNVLIRTDDHNHENELIVAFNDMVRNLGSLDAMRQDFISNVSHEIQSPLTSIMGFATLLKKEDLSDDERRHYAEIIEVESARLSKLSENLLKLTSLDKTPLNLEPFRLDKQIQNIILTLEPQWSVKNLLLEIDLPECEYRGDEGLLSQVWINLLHNAIKFTPSGGSISVALIAASNGVLVTVSDTGEGLSPDNQTHIFERFFKADKSRDRALGGNGLGLSIAKKIVELHRGQISVTSTLGEGTTFTVRLNSI
jgi:signal transduction histidine kinase